MISECRIRRLHLRGPDDASLRRGAVLLEDAFRVASFPIFGNRIVLVRRLDLGRLHLHSSSSLALLIERRLRDIQPFVVPGESAGAGSAPAVFFEDEASVCAALAVRLASHRPCTEWFWPLAFPELRKGSPREEVLRSILFSTAGTTGGLHSVAVLIETLLKRGVLARVLETLRYLDGLELLREAGLTLPPAVPVAVRLARQGPARIHEFLASSPPAAVEFLRAAAPWIEYWRADDPRSIWLMASALVLGNPARAMESSLAARASRLALEVERQFGRTKPIPKTDTAEPSASLGSQPDLRHGEVSESRGRDLHGPLPGQEPPFAEPVPRQAEDRDRGTEPVSIAEPVRPPANAPNEPNSEVEVDARRHPYAAATEFAGMYFIINVLGRIGLGEYLAANPEWIGFDLPTEILRAIARRLQIPDDDPILLPLSPEADLREPESYRAPHNWKGSISKPGSLRFANGAAPHLRLAYDATGRLPVAAWSGGFRRTNASAIPSVSAAAVDSWVKAARRLCRRQTTLGFPDLIRRPGQILSTRTHVDVIFDLNQADGRIRRAGFDLDPGWVPWFGRVITFHYL